MEKFSYEENGYSIKEVNQFVDDVIKETESVMIRIKRQKMQIEQLEKELQRYKTLEPDLKEAFQKTEETCENIKKLAYEESKMIILEAKNDASKIIDEALIRAEKIERKKEKLEKNMEVFKKKLRRIINQQLSVVEEIDILELEDK